MPELDTVYSVRTEADAVADVATRAAQPHPMEVGQIAVFPTDDGPRIVDLGTSEFDRRLDAPRRKTGLVRVESIHSFLTYYSKHSDKDTETFVDLDAGVITAVLDAHRKGGPRWGEHRLALTLGTTDEWQAWISHDRKPMSQLAFAEFVEDHLPAFRTPSAADMLEMAQTFQAGKKMTFESSNVLSNGERRLTYLEDTEATAGRQQQLQVPTKFTVGLVPLDVEDAGGKAEAFEIEARFRYRVGNGALQVHYLLDDPKQYLRDAIKDVVATIEAELSIPIMRGRPA